MVEHNLFTNDAGGGGPDGVRADDAYNLTIRNNLILNSTNPVSWLHSTGLIENNTIIGAIGNSGGIPVHHGIFTFLQPYNELVIRNNIMAEFQSVYEFGRACDTCDSTGLITFVHNAFWPPVDSFYSTWPQDPPEMITILDSANFNLYPMFTEDSSYTIQHGSPLIDTGDPALLDPDGSRSDIGMWGGPAGSTYTYIDLPPLASDPVTFQYSSPDVTLWWPKSHEGDFLEHEVWRDIVSGVLPPHSNHLATLPDGQTTFVDSNVPTGTPVYYRVIAYDSALNSTMSDEVAVEPTGILDEAEPTTPPLPLTPYIAAVRPNPFNASTVFEVDIPAVGASPAPVEILIYDTLGRLAATASSGSLPYGRQSIAWDGRGSDGRLPSGVYFATLKVWSNEFRKPTKIVLLR